MTFLHSNVSPAHSVNYPEIFSTGICIFEIIQSTKYYKKSQNRVKACHIITGNGSYTVYHKVIIKIRKCYKKGYI